MQSSAKINVSDIIDNSRIGTFQIGLFILCGLCLIMDGFDVQAIGFVAPALSKDWKITGAVLGSVLSAALVGVLFGSIFLSMLADKIGRRPVLIGACLFFSAVTLATSLVQTVPQLLMIRFIAGVGLGSIMPNAMALVGEYSPQRLRVPMMVVVGTGFTAGAVIGGIVAFWLVPNFGWRSVFVFGGAVPLLIGLLMFFLLPESLQYLALHGKDPERLGRWLHRVNPDVTISRNTQFIVREQRQKGVPMIKLFQQGRAAGTILLWTVYFMNLLNLYFLSSWLPTVLTPLVKAARVPDSYALLFGSTLQMGGVIGAIALGWLVARFGFVPVLATAFLFASANIALIGQPGFSLGLVFVVVFVAGFGVVGGQSTVNALAATLYPTDLRSTGIGAGLGIGRIGSIVGPQVAGLLIGTWTTNQLFLGAAVPALIASVAMVAMRWVIKPHRTANAQSEVMVH
ncbi:MAG: aromatic acid/H+ symport family MFS transporter [Terriglobia bacterium]|nr:MAG: aromatic acid/H+ symport family MFS transporter [Terriglobia bacterium]